MIAASYWHTGDQFTLAVSRLDVSGAPDSSFSVQGLAQATFGGDCTFAGSFVDSSDRSVIHGFCLFSGSTESEFIGRMTENGAIDDTFGSNGVVLTTALAPFDALGVTTPLDQNGRYLLPGTCGTPAAACVVRLWNDAIFGGPFDL